MGEGIGFSIAVAAALAATAMSVTAAAADSRLVRGPDPFVVEIVDVKGSGCSTDTVSVTTAEDRQSFGVIYSDYKAQAGGSSKPADGRKNCAVAVKVHLPSDITYAISSTDHRGYATLMRGASAEHRYAYYFQGQTDGFGVSHKLNGTYDDHWKFTGSVPADQLLFKRCGEERNFHFNTELRAVRGSDASLVSFITMGTSGNNYMSTYNLAFKRCP